MKFKLLYFAGLSDHAGCVEEILDTQERTLLEVYSEVRAKHAFSLGAERLRVAVNGAIVGWQHELHENDEIVFLPPVSGG